MIPNPIRKVLSVIQEQRVRALLMGGQACVLYGAAEFSRDIDIAILPDQKNLAGMRRALAELHAEVIAVPPFHAKHLRRGHAVHFRCRHPEADRVRIDVMSTMRGVAAFSQLWRRRTTLVLPDGLSCNVLSLPDLVAAKKTQRDKDWPMIRRLIEAHYFQHRQKPNRAQIQFWLRELRTPELLHELALHYPGSCQSLRSVRPLLLYALSGDLAQISNELSHEEAAEREKDRTYWIPLRKELENLRHSPHP